MDEPTTGGARVRPGWIVLAWTVVALVVTAQAQLRLVATDEGPPWWTILGFQLAYWYAWAAVTPWILHTARRWPLRRERRVRRVLLHALLATAASVVLVAYFAFLMVRLAGEGVDQLAHPVRAAFLRYMAIGFHYDFLTYGAVLALGLALESAAEARERSRRAEKLETRLVEAQLQALRMQLQPHFLFNTLHAIASLVSDEPEAAKRMIARLGELLRLTLQRGDVAEVTLEEELEVVDCYLSIEEVRFADRLAIVREVEPACRAALVPSLLLQPVVENAVRHGVSRRVGAGRIELCARRDGERLVIEVKDDGPGPGARVEPGIGLANVRARLEQVHGREAFVSLETDERGGSCARVTLPFRRAEEPR